VGVSTATHIGTRLIELPLTDKDYIAVSEEVIILPVCDGELVMVVLCLFCRCKVPFVITGTVAELEGSSNPTASLK